jgi:hypothetical protein
VIRKGAQLFSFTFALRVLQNLRKGGDARVFVNRMARRL